VKNFEDIFIRFDRIHERDTHTGTAWRHRPCLHSIAWQKVAVNICLLFVKLYESIM